MSNSVIGDNLARLRKNKGISMRKLSDDTGISYGSYTGYEYGRREPNREVIVKLAEYFGTTTDEILGIEKDSPAETAEEPITMDELIQFLQKLGFLKDGEQDISESDLRFLKATIASLGEWFSERTK